MWRFAVALLLSAELASACSCSHLTDCGLVQQPVIFIGKVVAGGVESLRDNPWYKSAKSVRLEVVESFRGLPPGTKFVDVETPLWPGMCSPNPYRPGRTYLVAPSTQDGKFVDGICFTGRDVEHIPDTVDYVRRHFRNPGFSIRGRVAATDHGDSSLVGFLLSQDEAVPLRGVRVWTSSKGRNFSAVTDASGRYELAVPGPGKYAVHAGFPPYPSASVQVELPAGAACELQDFPMLSGSSISGRVYDRHGQPLQDARVGLIDVSRPAPDPQAPVRFRTAYAEQPGGRFLFENVPLGRYLLVFNPDGPQAEGYKSSPLETTFYPNGVPRAQAQVIEIGRPGMSVAGQDLIVGQPISFRSVTVKVRFPDGAPMTTAQVDVVCESAEPGGIPWIAREIQSGRKTQVRFQVPAGRALRISVTDWYGRPLKQPYESAHPSGSAPIVQEFVVVP